MTFRRHALALVATLAALVTVAGPAQADIPAQQLPDAQLAAVGFHRDGDVFRDIDPKQVMYPSACAPATVDDQYSAPSAHRGREYPVTGFAAAGVSGPAGTVGVDIHAYESADRAVLAFDRLRSLFDRPCPLDHDSIAWEFLRESPVVGTGDPYAPAQAFTVTAGNEILGSRTAVTFSLRDNALVAAGYRVDPGGGAPEPDRSAGIADQAARAALAALTGH